MCIFSIFTEGIPLQLVLVRHGLPLRVEQERGRADPPLAELGHLQAKQVGARLALERIDAIYSSPLRRAVETAEPLAQTLSLRPIIRDDIAEFDRDASQYIPMEQLKVEDYAAWKAFADGSYGEDVDMQAFQRPRGGLLGGHHPSPPWRTRRRCHGGVVNVWAANVLGMPVRLFVNVDYASISRFMCASTGERNILSLNEAGYGAAPDANAN